jgi:hypothetical protein
MFERDYWEDLLIKCDLYGFKCTKQEEKFDYYRRNGVTDTWADCEAAWDLVNERPDAYILINNYRKYRSYPADDWTGTLTREDYR